MRWATEPVVHFTLVGFGLFVGSGIYQRHHRDDRIVITPRHVEQLANAYQLQFGTRPDSQTLAALVARDVHDEILYRQGVRLALDQGDEIVRRRVMQKMQFVLEDLDAPPTPTDSALHRYYAAHAGRYITPERATFSHIYFSSDSARAARVLRTLPPTTTRAPETGDAFPDLYDFSAYEPEQVDRLFGHTPFADAVFSAPPGRWVGPFRSGYGWHLLYVSARTDASPALFEQVRDQVRADYVRDAEDAANAAAYDSVARRFTVVREGP